MNILPKELPLRSSNQHGGSSAKDDFDAIQTEISHLRELQAQEGLGPDPDFLITVEDYPPSNPIYKRYSYFDPAKKESSRSKGGMKHCHIKLGELAPKLLSVNRHNSRATRLLALQKRAEELEQKLYSNGSVRAPLADAKRVGQIDLYGSNDPSNELARPKPGAARFSVAIFQWVYCRNIKKGLKRGPLIYRVLGSVEEPEKVRAKAKFIVKQLNEMERFQPGRSHALLRAEAQKIAAVIRQADKPQKKLKPLEEPLSEHTSSIG